MRSLSLVIDVRESGTDYSVCIWAKMSSQPNMVGKHYLKMPGNTESRKLQWEFNWHDLNPVENE